MQLFTLIYLEQIIKEKYMMKILNKNRFKNKPDAILIDTDNTIYPYEPSHLAAMEALKEKVSKEMNISFSDFDTCFNQAKLDVKSRLENTAASHSRLLYMQRFLELLGLGSKFLLALDLEQTYWKAFLNASKLFPNLRSFLDDCRLMAIPVINITDLTSQIQYRKIIYFDLDDSFDAIVTSEEAGTEKTSKEPFELAIKKIGRNVNNVWMIGDNS